ncbi:MAG: twin-arginine translocase TatA/TatE family subunit [Deltaproteobacteria bacterium]|nr:twin-arginine translocase TatA/TatE family subunit [Deltaproteobacteria bacterium]
MFGLGATELIIIAVILFFLFGAKRLPEIGKGLGGAIREFRKVKGELNSNEVAADEKEKLEHKKESRSDSGQ